MGVFFIWQGMTADGSATIYRGRVVVAETSVQAVKAYIRNHKRILPNARCTPLVGVFTVQDHAIPLKLREVQAPYVDMLQTVMRTDLGPNLLREDETLRDYIDALRQFGRVRLPSDIFARDT